MSEKPSLTQIMNMAQQMQKSMQDMQKTLVQKKVTGVAGADDLKVEVIMNGQQQVEKVNLGSGVLAQKSEVIEELFAGAANDAIAKVKKITQEAMMDLYQRSGMPTGE